MVEKGSEEVGRTGNEKALDVVTFDAEKVLVMKEDDE